MNRRHKVSFSIVIPAYFSSAFINRLITTIPQDDRVEVIVVDDSYDDEEHARLAFSVTTGYQGAIVAKNKYGKGVCGARNTGLTLAQGKWIIFADSDDTFYSERLLAKMNEYEDSDTDQVLFRYDSKIIDTDRLSVRHKYADYIFDQYRDKSQLAAFVNIGTVCMRFIKTEVIRRNGIQFQKQYRIAEDALFMTEVSLASKKLTLDDAILYTIQDREDSVTRAMDYSLLRNWLDAQHARNSALQASSDRIDYRQTQQTRLVILLKALRQLGLSQTFKLNRYALSLRIPLVRQDELRYLWRRLWSRS